MTAVLVFGAVVTALIANAADGAALDPVGLILVTAGAALIALVALRRPSRRGGRVVTAGPLLFARYAYPPNALGLLRRRRDPDAARVRQRRGRPTEASPSSRARSRGRGRTSS